MRALILVATAALALSACDSTSGDSAPSEESPVAPAVVCEEAADNSACVDYDTVITNEDIADGNVVTEGETVTPTTEEAFATNAS
jgi:outer membrane protein assembly factor BamE (lipoprotein component of BamABCDE complex)